MRSIDHSKARKKAKFGAYATKRVSAGAHLPTKRKGTTINRHRLGPDNLIVRSDDYSMDFGHSNGQIVLISENSGTIYIFNIWQHDFRTLWGLKNHDHGTIGDDPAKDHEYESKNVHPIHGSWCTVSQSDMGSRASNENPREWRMES